MNLGRVGIWTGQPGLVPVDGLRRAVREIEDLGYGTLWVVERHAG